MSHWLQAVRFWCRSDSRSGSGNFFNGIFFLPFNEFRGLSCLAGGPRSPSAASLNVLFAAAAWCRISMKKALRETQTLRAGCSKAEPKMFAPAQTPFPGAQDRQNLISWRWSLPSLTDPVWWRSMHAISSYRGNRPTNKHTQTDRTDYNTLRR